MSRVLNWLLVGLLAGCNRPGSGSSTILADFQASTAAGPAPLRVAFEDRSQGSVTSWSWDFGDGSGSSERSPVHVYGRPGAYTVRLSVSGAGGADVEAKDDLVRVGRAERPNVALIILDDVGVDLVAAYGEAQAGLPPACTPSLDALAAGGMLFRRAHASPLCSPTRAMILTGRHGFRTGIGELVDHAGTRSGLSATLERTLPEILTGYDSSHVGKWHLASPASDGQQHPLECGFRYFAGAMFNLTVGPVDFGSGALDCQPNGPLGYFNWVKVRDPLGTGQLEQTCSTTYATSDTADEAIARARTMSWPWFLEVSFNAAHLPAELPPLSLCPPSGSCGIEYCRAAVETAEVVNAMIEGLDRELGRVLASLREVDPDVYVILIGDNGSATLTARGAPGSCFSAERSKGTLYEGGIRVPLIVSGPDVVPGSCDALVSAVDLFATIADLAEVPAEAQDSVSLVPYLRGETRVVRSSVYAESFSPNFVSPDAGGAPFEPRTHSRAILNERYKLIRSTTRGGFEDELFFDLHEDPCEERDLCPGLGPGNPALLAPDQAANLLALQAELAGLGVY